MGAGGNGRGGSRERDVGKRGAAGAAFLATGFEADLPPTAPGLSFRTNPGRIVVGRLAESDQLGEKGHLPPGGH